MRSRLSWLARALGVVALLAYPFLIHAAASKDLTEPLRSAIALGPILALGIWLAARSRQPRRWLAACAAAAAALAWFQSHQVDLSLAYGAPHAAAYLFLLALFGGSLRSGREAIVTRFARHIHGGLPAELAAYTRRVTWAWCGFFAAMLVASALLYLCAPLSAWSLFINVLNLPLLALMFVAEYVVRIRRYPGFRHSSILTGVRLLSRLDAAAAESGESR